MLELGHVFENHSHTHSLTHTDTLTHTHTRTHAKHKTIGLILADEDMIHY